MDKELLHFLSTNLQKGHSPQTLRKQLVNQGWSPRVVDEAIFSLRQHNSRMKREQTVRPQKPRTPTGRKSFTHRTPILVVLLGFVTLGIYSVYWLVKTKQDLNRAGADIITCWILVIPIVNIYFDYRFAKGFVSVSKKENSVGIWFLLLLFLFPVAIFLIQSELNNY